MIYLSPCAIIFLSICFFFLKIAVGDLKAFFDKINEQLCESEPLPKKEIDSIWNSALEFVRWIRKQQRNRHQNAENQYHNYETEKEDLIISITE